MVVVRDACGPIATLARCPCGQIADVDTEYAYPCVRSVSVEVPRPHRQRAGPMSLYLLMPSVPRRDRVVVGR